MHRSTLVRRARVSGVGLFSAKPATLSLLPAPAGQGIAIRPAGDDETPIPCSIGHLSTNPIHACFPPGISGRNTTIAAFSSAPRAFATLEHVLSACAGLGVTDALLELDGPEIPILDGSAGPFVDAILDAGIARLETPVNPCILPHAVEVVDDRSGARIRAIPREQPGTFYSYTLDYAGSPLGATFPPQSAEFDSRRGDYARTVAPARTFSLEKEARSLHAAGLFKHLSPRDMLVIDDRARPLNNTLRFENEPARHKLLDLIGDVSLLGAPVQADIHAERSGHALTHELVRRILACAV